MGVMSIIALCGLVMAGSVIIDRRFFRGTTESPPSPESAASLTDTSATEADVIEAHATQVSDTEEGDQ